MPNQPSKPVPKVSVVIPARDSLRWLPGAIASVGPARDVEILVVDGGSGDGTWDYLQALAAQDGRIRPLRAPRPGAAAARNAGLEAAEAPFIAFLDPEDRLRAGFLRAHVALHRLFPQIGFSVSDHRRFAEDGTELPGGFARCPAFAARHAMRREGFVLDRDAQAQIYAEPVVATSAVLARTALLRAVGGFNEQLRRGAEGWDLWLHLAACAPVGCLPRPMLDKLVRAHDPSLAGEAARRAARRQVAAAYAGAAGALDPAALRLCAASQLAIEADAAALAGRRLRAALLRLSALRLPGRALLPS